ncbi:ABC transporter permease [Clostridium sp.]|uniref:ABC transporter permease n=1 Tax=Clostridium sp. TaxID=1506 RepID=UPI002FC5BAE9
MNNNIVGLVFKKELMDIFRDRKTILVSILIPLIIFPIMFSVLGKGISKTTEDAMRDMKIALVDSGSSSLTEFIRTQKDVVLIESQDVQKDVKDGNISVAIEIPKDFDEKIKNEQQVGVTLILDNASQTSSIVAANVQSFIQEYSQMVVSNRLNLRNIDVNLLTPISVEQKTITGEENGASTMMLSMMLPLLLVMYCITGPIPAATDLGAGEKERGTLEPLLTTQAGRMALLYGKFLAITLLGIITALASLIGLYISFMMDSSLFTGGGSTTAALTIDYKTFVFIFIIAVLTTMVFGALELAISIYARSFKEAQTYITPLTVIGIIPIYATYMLDVKNISTMYFHIPLANVVCLLKELIIGIYNYTHIGITLGWTIVYIVISLLIARAMFNKEEVIFRT